MSLSGATMYAHKGVRCMPVKKFPLKLYLFIFTVCMPPSTALQPPPPPRAAHNILKSTTIHTKKVKINHRQAFKKCKTLNNKLASKATTEKICEQRVSIKQTICQGLEGKLCGNPCTRLPTHHTVKNKAQFSF